MFYRRLLITLGFDRFYHHHQSSFTKVLREYNKLLVGYLNYTELDYHVNIQYDLQRIEMLYVCLCVCVCVCVRVRVCVFVISVYKYFIKQSNFNRD